MAVPALLVVWLLADKRKKKDPAKAGLNSSENSLWRAPDRHTIPENKYGDLIRYGKKWIANAALYLRPKGIVSAMSDGMNCQNCHFDAGTRLFDNNYSAVFPTYLKFRERSATVENIYRRGNDCFQRSLNGSNLDTLGLKMRAISACINWLGQNLIKYVKPGGSGTSDLSPLSRAADFGGGQEVYTLRCQLCHGANGGG